MIDIQMQTRYSASN